MAEQNKYYGMDDVARLVGVSYGRIWYYMVTGRLPEPGRVGRSRVFSEADVAAIREFFFARTGHHDEMNT